MATVFRMTVTLLGLFEIHQSWPVSGTSVLSTQENGVYQTTEGSVLYDSLLENEVTTIGSDSFDSEKERRAVASLKTYIRNLPTNQEKVAPTVIDKQGKRSVTLNALVRVLSLVRVDDAQQTVTTSLYLDFRWQDKSLAWNFSQYGAKKVAVPADYIWTPILLVVNSRDNVDMLSDSAYFWVQMDGTVTVEVPIYVETFCSLDMTQYPYDEQLCNIFIHSPLAMTEWVLTHDQNASQIYADSMKTGSEWEIVETGVESVVLPVTTVKSPKIIIRLRRKTMFYTVCLVLPMALTSYMNTLVFLVPLQSGEKVSYLVSIFVSTSVFVSYFMTVMPRGLDSVPITLKLLIGVIIESFLVLLATIVVLQRFHHHDRPKISRDHPLRESATNGGRDHKDNHNEAMAADGYAESDHEYECRDKVKLEVLDRVLFALFFVGNTSFLAALLYQSVE